MADFGFSDREAHETRRQAEAYLRKELPGFENLIEWRKDPSQLVFHVRGPFLLNARAEVSTYPILTDPSGGFLAQSLDELIETTRDGGIFALGLEPRIEERVEIEVARQVRDKQAEWERKGYTEGMEAGVRVALAAKKDADLALDEIEGEDPNGQ
jgi:hypothetical protein